MASIAERLSSKVELCESLAVANPSLPTVFAIPLPNGPNSGETFPFPSLTAKHEMRVTFRSDGGISVAGRQRTPVGLGLFGSAVTKFTAADGERCFGLIVNGEGSRKQCRDGWTAWAELAKGIAPILWAFPETGVSSMTNPASALLAYVFGCAYGTSMVSQHDGFLAVTNLWAATLVALSTSRAETCDPAKRPSRPVPKGSQQVLRSRGRGNPGISGAESQLRREILAKAQQFHSQAEAAANLFDEYRGKVIAATKTGTPMRTVEDFNAYIAACKDWLRKQPTKAARSEKAKRKKP
ncbi:MAG TPA: hypothetical protein VM165_12625 [Planctomycetaceae bacterium]|nr:hypothetical protein [Planctomycetaceae bacterium]